MSEFLLQPPVAFILILVVCGGMYVALKGVTFKRPGSRGSQAQPYACGENVSDKVIQPDYGQFFPFAFFFTILHVVALMVTTAPVGHGAILLAVLYLVGAVVGLSILFRKRNA